MRHDDTGVQVIESHWSPALQASGRACSDDAAACRPLIAEQVETMAGALERAEGAEITVAAAATLSAIADLCYRSGVAIRGETPRHFLACPLNRRMAEAGIRWLQLGRVSLAIDYLRQHLWHRGQFMASLASRNEEPSASVRAQLFDFPPWLMATVAELGGQFSDARVFWQQALHTDIVAGRPRPQLRRAFYSLVRLSWRLGDTSGAALWEAALAKSAGDGLADICLELGYCWRVATARSRAEGSPSPAAGDRLAQLLQADCGFSKPLIEHATDSLLAGRADAQLVEALDRGVRACGGDCAPERLQHLQVLRQLASGAAGAAEVAAGIRTQLVQSAGAMDQELQIAWAAAATLVRQPATHAAGAGIYRDLQALLMTRANLDNADTHAAQGERLRYEGVHRAATLAALQTGATLDIEQMESLRAQRLLRRLRLQSRAAELEAVSEPAARQRYDDTLQQVRSLRRQFDAALPQETAAGQATLHAILQASHVLVEDIEVMARLTLLEALAARANWKARLLIPYAGSCAAAHWLNWSSPPP